VRENQEEARRRAETGVAPTEGAAVMNGVRRVGQIKCVRAAVSWDHLRWQSLVACPDFREKAHAVLVEY
jgi:hypothetical protein